MTKLISRRPTVEDRHEQHGTITSAVVTFSLTKRQHNTTYPGSRRVMVGSSSAAYPSAPCRWLRWRRVLRADREHHREARRWAGPIPPCPSLLSGDTRVTVTGAVLDLRTEAPR